MSPAGLHVYGFIPADRVFTVDAKGVSAGGVRCIAEGQIAAIIGPASPDDYIGSRRELTAHTAVLEEALGKTGAVAPARFGQIAPDEDAVRSDAIGAKADVLSRLLGEVDGHVEMTAKAYWKDEALFPGVTERDPRIPSMREALVGRSEAETYYERIELGKRVADAIAAWAQEVEDDMAKETHGVAIDVSALARAAESQAAGFAYRIRRRDEAALDAAMERFVDKYDAVIRLKYVGPSPLFHFLSREMESL